MVDGRQNNNLGIIIQARMKSERLPGKVLRKLHILNGPTILEQICIEVSKLNGVIIVATSIDSSNDLIESFCKDNNIICFRGSEEDVLSRYVTIQKKFNFEQIIRLTADNPFIDSNIIEEVLSVHKSGNFDYSISKGLPLGMNIEIVNGNSLIDSQEYVEFESDREHVTPVLKRSVKYRKGEMKYDLNLDNIRVTIDTNQDYLVAVLLSEISLKYNINGLNLIQLGVDKFPWLFDVNRSIIQKNSKLSVKEEVNDAINLLLKFDYKQSALFLERINDGK